MTSDIMLKQEVGSAGEELAVQFLRKNGCKILHRNYRTRWGEIDVIAQCGKVIIFVEVKTRSTADFAQPWEAVGFRKRKHLKTAARIYIQEYPSSGCEFRFDVLSITLKESCEPGIEWIQQAF